MSHRFCCSGYTMLPYPITDQPQFFSEDTDLTTITNPDGNNSSKAADGAAKGDIITIIVRNWAVGIAFLSGTRDWIQPWLTDASTLLEHLEQVVLVFFTSLCAARSFVSRL